MAPPFLIASFFSAGSNWRALLMSSKASEDGCEGRKSFILTGASKGRLDGG